MLEFVPDCYKTQKMCEETVEYVPEMLEFIPDQLKTQEICEKAVGNYP